MNDEHLDDTIRELARDYNEGPASLDAQRREAMWAAIVAQRQRSTRRVRMIPRQAWWPMAAAALLLLGIGLGQYWPTSTGTPAPDGASTGATDSDGDASEAHAPRWSQESAKAIYRYAARDYLRRTQTQLTRYRQASTEVDREDVDLPMTDWAASLLLNTRMYLDSPLADDESMRELLEDLEVVLARIVQSSGDYDRTEEEAFILEGMRRRDILERLQKNLPARATLSQPATGT
jgi:hypothetical protein